MSQLLLQHLLRCPVLPLHLRDRILVKIVEKAVKVHPAENRYLFEI